jgi:hypothetical protein
MRTISLDLEGSKTDHSDQASFQSSKMAGSRRFTRPKPATELPPDAGCTHLKHSSVRAL